MGEWDELNARNEYLRKEYARMQEEEKRVSEKAEQEKEKMTVAVNRNSGSTWKEMAWRIGGMTVMIIVTAVLYPDVSDFKRMMFVLLWLIWSELFIINSRRK